VPYAGEWSQAQKGKRVRTMHDPIFSSENYQRTGKTQPEKERKKCLHKAFIIGKNPITLPFI
jgi:hypothetical protein